MDKKQFIPNDDEFGVPIYIIEKNPKEQIRIGVNEYHGIDYIDVRIFYFQEGKYLPSKKGITCKKEQYFELMKGIVMLGEFLGYDEEILQKSMDE